MQKKFAQLMVFGDPDTGKALVNQRLQKWQVIPKKEVIKAGMTLPTLELIQRLFNT